MIGGKVLGKTMARWLNVASRSPAIFFTDVQDCVLASLADEDAEVDKEVVLPWAETSLSESNVYGQREESPLELVPAGAYASTFMTESNTESLQLSDDSHGDVDDTFSFRKFNQPAQGQVRGRKV
jgi:hypothetical protein